MANHTTILINDTGFNVAASIKMRKFMCVIGSEAVSKKCFNVAASIKMRK